MSNKTGWLLVVATALAFVHCGGRSTSDRAAPDGGDVPAAGSAGNAGLGACDDAGAAEGGCASAAGASALEQYARLRTACGLGVSVNGHGHPVAICYQIK